MRSRTPVKPVEIKAALRDFDSDVVKSASAALSQFKGDRVSAKGKKPSHKHKSGKKSITQ